MWIGCGLDVDWVWTGAESGDGWKIVPLQVDGRDVGAGAPPAEQTLAIDGRDGDGSGTGCGRCPTKDVDGLD